jgi:SAM-dependent methyltransferase
MERRVRALQRYFDEYWLESSFGSRRVHDFAVIFDECILQGAEWLGDAGGKRILEIGPGLDDSAFLFTGEGAQVTSIDISFESLRQMDLRFQNAGLHNGPHLVMMDAETMGFPPESFDIVYMKKTLMHVNPLRVARSAWSIIKPGGKLILIEPLRYNPFVNLYRALFSVGRFVTCRYPTWGQLDEMRDLFSSSRYEVFYLLSMILLPVMKFRTKSTRLQSAFLALKSIDAFLIRHSTMARRMGWIIVMELVK